jgi:hypothetical protein
LFGDVAAPDEPPEGLVPAFFSVVTVVVSGVGLFSVEVAVVDESVVRGFWLAEDGALAVSLSPPQAARPAASSHATRSAGQVRRSELIGRAAPRPAGAGRGPLES